MPKMTLRKFVSLIIIGLGILVLLLAIGIKVASRVFDAPSVTNYEVEDKNQVPEDNFKITHVINKGAGQEVLTVDYILAKGEKQTVFGILKNLSASKGFGLEYNYKYAEFGVFIESIAGVPNGKDGKYWQYYVNDKLGEVAADKKEVKAGDKVEWRFEKVDF